VTLARGTETGRRNAVQPSQGDGSPAIADPEGVQFLQWALPRLGLRWPGFRKVRRRVHKRLARRLRELGLTGLGAYRQYLDTHPLEWRVLETFCWIPISRFYRDRAVFEHLRGIVLPHLATMAVSRDDVVLRAWSIGCASGEEPYTLSILWALSAAARFPTLRLDVVATDVDPAAIERARLARYPPGTLKDLPPDWRRAAFSQNLEGYRLKDEFGRRVQFLAQDVREVAPAGPFHLVFCRNLAFTYFDDPAQRQVLATLRARMPSGAALVIGGLESLPEGEAGFEPWAPRLRIFRRQ
jgi:chemotaxis protein methyltransferase CheR